MNRVRVDQPLAGEGPPWRAREMVGDLHDGDVEARPQGPREPFDPGEAGSKRGMMEEDRALRGASRAVAVDEDGVVRLEARGERAREGQRLVPLRSPGAGAAHAEGRDVRLRRSQVGEQVSFHSETVREQLLPAHIQVALRIAVLRNAGPAVQPERGMLGPEDEPLPQGTE